MASIPAVMLRVVSVWTVLVESVPGGLRNVRQLTRATPCLLLMARELALVGPVPWVMFSMCTFLPVRVLVCEAMWSCLLLASGWMYLPILMLV